MHIDTVRARLAELVVQALDDNPLVIVEEELRNAGLLARIAHELQVPEGPEDKELAA